MERGWAGGGKCGLCVMREEGGSLEKTLGVVRMWWHMGRRG
jgi:hypothetical protein